MTSPTPAPREPAELFFDGYTVICLAALAAILLIELPAVRLSTPALVLVGGAGVLLRLRLAPLLLVAALAAGHLLEQHRLTGLGWDWQMRPRSFETADVLLSIAVLAYVAAHYRLQSVKDHVFPPDPRVREGPPRPGGRQRPVARLRRSARLASAEEVGLLVMLLPLPALAAQLCWVELARPWRLLGLPPQIGRLLLVVWVLAVGALIVAALLGHWRARRMTGVEGTLFLQDTLWQETRRDQRMINRWLAWAKLRRRRREES